RVRAINRCCIDLTGECSCPVNSEKPTLWTTAPTFTKTQSSVHPVYRPCLSFWVHCTDVFNFPNVGSTGDTKIPGVLQVNGPKRFQGAALRPARGGSPSTPSANRL